jgi:hypothetical protein
VNFRSFVIRRLVDEPSARRGTRDSVDLAPAQIVELENQLFQRLKRELTLDLGAGVGRQADV